MSRTNRTNARCPRIIDLVLDEDLEFHPELVPVDEYEALEETSEILSDHDTLLALSAGLDELARGETIEFDELRRELAERRATR